MRMPKLRGRAPLRGKWGWLVAGAGALACSRDSRGRQQRQLPFWLQHTSAGLAGCYLAASGRLQPSPAGLLNCLCLARDSTPPYSRGGDDSGDEGGPGEAAAAAADEEEEEPQAFSPERGNVAFGSAYDGWAFRIDQFAEMYAGGWQGEATLCVCVATVWLLGDRGPSLFAAAYRIACQMPLFPVCCKRVPRTTSNQSHPCLRRSQDGVQGRRAAAGAVGGVCLPAQDKAHRAHQG